MISICFMGSGPFASKVLELLHKEQQFDISLVITQPRRPQGRKNRLVPTEVFLIAEELGIQTFECANSSQILEVVKPDTFDFLLVCDYGVLLKQPVIDLPLCDTLNIHGSLLPKYRGASPIQESLKNGDSITGVCLQSMVLKLDAGDVYSEMQLNIPSDMLFEELRDKLAWLGSKLVLQSLPSIIDGSLVKKPQNESLVSHCSKIAKSDGLIDFQNQNTTDIYNLFRAYNLWPKAHFVFKEQTIIIHGCNIANIEIPSNITPGMFFIQDKQLFVACKTGVLEIIKLQMPSKQPMEVKSFLNGRPTFFVS